MAEPDKRQFGDGSDNYSQAASDLVRAANEARFDKVEVSLWLRET